MRNFRYVRAENAQHAVALAAATPGAKFLGGGTNLVDLMREGIEQSDMVIDITHLSRGIETLHRGGLLIGAAATNADVAQSPLVRDAFPVLSQAIVSGASGQLRNAATVGGNLLQRTRCLYFYDGATRCNKRNPGIGCDAIGGFNRSNAVLGTSDSCIATHPSDMCVALAALDTVVHVEGTHGPRRIPFNDFHRLPQDTPARETTLEPGELITSVEIAPLPMARTSLYRKVRDRSSYAFALVSVAAALDVADGRIREARIALGGVAPKPWRARRAEALLKDAEPNAAAFEGAAAAELEAATGYLHNRFKIELAQRVIVRALRQLSEPTRTS